MKMKVLFFAISLFLGMGITANAAKVNGNGNIITKEVQVSDYNSIRIGSGIECNSRLFGENKFENPVFNFTQTKGSTSLTVTIDENLFSLLEINTSGNELTIGVKRGTKINPSRMNIKGVSKELQQVSVSGCVDFTINDNFNSDRLEINISGASDVKINDQSRIGRLKIHISGAGDFVADNLTCNQIESSVSGAGDITLKGKADTGKFTVTGAGDIKAYDFIVKNLECRVSGAGDIKVMATETLDASVSGTGDIRYKGNAKANTRVSGFGNIKKIEN